MPLADVKRVYDNKKEELQGFSFRINYEELDYEKIAKKIKTQTIKIKKLYPDAQIPFRGSEQAAGVDLYAYIKDGDGRPSIVTVAPHYTKMLDTGIAIEIPDGYFGLIAARSGLATKQNLAPANKIGVIDSDYRASIKVALHNHGDMLQIIHDGDRIAQLIIMPYITPVFEEVEELNETKRGEGGFGSSGTK